MAGYSTLMEEHRETHAPTPSSTRDRVVAALEQHEAGWHALHWAAAEAAAHRVPLRIHHCWQAVRDALPAPGSTMGIPVPTLGQEPSPVAGMLLDEGVRRVRALYPGLPVDGALLEGRAGPALAAAARPGDLLVLGLRSTHRFAARLLGSTVSYLLRHAPCPIAVLPPGGPDNPGPFQGHVIAALDGTPPDDEVLAVAFAEAAAHRLPLVAAHAEETDEPVSGSVVDEQMLQITLVPHPKAYGVLQEELAPWRARYPDVPVRRATFRGAPAAVLRRIVAGAAMLVLGRSRRTWRPVSLVDLVLSDARCPVLVTPPPVRTSPVPASAPGAGAAPGR